ncbi:Rpn family recombination-promoting nuclease/putative transposase [Candidatus Williamhamiltonella defendens]|uniref:Transposase n=1 Tax=Candidatus Williamhamiltonella defendens TaxID=138072 RepID=A0A2D3TEF8_9ENTR|nr:Rpn family recombination-promoting nuclease/putative transposase [Candidatus Hamiltonella defensa]ATW34175.1 transposase [Candidatus Hamiltonella defensa]
MKMFLPHDALFKQFLGDIALARNFFEVHLPEDVLSQVCLSSLKRVSGSFVEPTLKQSHSDMVYSFETVTGKDGYLYCLLEHQSTADKMMAFRMKKYSLAVMQQHLDQGYSTLPLVVPVLFYHGETSPYPYSLDWFDCFDDKEAARRLDSEPFTLVDVTVIPEEDILKHGMIAWLELVQKLVRVRDMMDIAPYLIRLDKRFPLNDDLFKSLLYYLFQEGETASRPLFFEALSSTTQRENVMTIAEELRKEGLEEGLKQGVQQGIQQGIQQGVQQGKEEGLKQATLAIAKKLMADGESPEKIQKYTGLSREDIDRLFH